MLPEDVLPIAGQGLDGPLDLLRAMRSGVTYINVHSDAWPGGELRGQVRPAFRDDDDDEDDD